MNSQQTVVVTGGAGFIGSHLCEALLGAGYTVVCVDNFLTGTPGNIAHLKDNPQFEFVEHDVQQPLVYDGEIAFLFHLASPASVIDYQNHPKETALANSVGTMHLLDLAEKKHARFLFASTSEVYGDPKEHPQKETYWGNVNPNGVRACYDEAKRFGEMMTMLYVRQHGVDGRIIRIFNTYGPRLKPTDGRVVSNFVTQALAGIPMTVYGDGSQTRSFCYVSDLVDGMMKLMFTDGAKGEVVNVGNPEEYTMVEIASKVKEMTGSASEIVFEPLPADDPVKRKPDITKATTLLGWKPIVSLEEGLRQTITYYKDHTV